MNVIFVITWIVIVDNCLDILDICKKLAIRSQVVSSLTKNDSSDSDKIQKVIPGPFVRQDHRKVDTHEVVWVRILLIPEQLPFPIQILQRIRQIPLFAIRDPYPHNITRQNIRYGGKHPEHTRVHYSQDSALLGLPCRE